MTTNNPEHYVYWNRVQKGERVGVTERPTLRNCGYYRRPANKDKTIWLSVVISPNEGRDGIVFVEDGVVIEDQNDINTSWMWAAKNAVSYDLYEAHYKSEDGTWSDHKVAQEQATEKMLKEAENLSEERDRIASEEAERRAFEEEKKAARHGIGGNNPPDAFTLRADDLEYKTLKARELMESREWDCQKDADDGRSLKDQIVKIRTGAESERKEEIRPHLDAQNAINEKYKKLKADAASIEAELIASYEPFLLREAARLREEAERKERERLAEVERLRKQEEEEQQRIAQEREAEERRAKESEESSSEPTAPDLFSQPEPEPQPEPQPQLEPVAAALPEPQLRVGPKGNVALRKVVTFEITDYDKLYAALKDHPDMVEHVNALAKRAVNKNHPLPGLKRIEKDAAR